jgi:hypothetical protein
LEGGVLRVLPKPYLLVLAVALTILAALGVVSLATPTLATTPVKVGDGNPPEFALMQGEKVIQKGRASSTCWSWWEEFPDSVEKNPPPPSKWNTREGGYIGYCADIVAINKWDPYPRYPVLVPVGSTLHIRIAHARRPDRVQFDEGPKPRGRGRALDYTLRRYRPGEKTVAWDVFFRVNRPDRHYYLHIWAQWDRVPGKHKSYGDSGRFFHVKTR